MLTIIIIMYIAAGINTTLLCSAATNENPDWRDVLMGIFWPLLLLFLVIYVIRDYFI